MMPTIILHHYWRSSCSHRVRIALECKGVRYEKVAVNLLAGRQSVPEYTGIAPSGYVPCLVVDGEPFVESVAILELLEELFPTPALYPTDAKDRARMRALVETINSGIQPLQNLNVLSRLSADQEVRAQWVRHFIEKGLAAFDALLTQLGRAGAFCWGDAPTAADVVLVPQMHAARRFGADMSQLARLVHIDERARALPAFARAEPDAQPDAVR
jgi:maleylacetoacetate isomerase